MVKTLHLNAVDDLSDFDLALERRDSPVSPSPTGSKFTTVNMKREPEEDSLPDETPTKKTKTTPKKLKQNEESTPVKMKTAAIGDCYEDLAPEDKMVVKWRDAGRSYKDISEEWEKMTSNKPGGSTMKGRYRRLKAAITNVELADRDKIETCRAECVQEIETQKKALDAKLWMLVAEKMRSCGTKDYPPATIEKQWKKMSAKPSANEDATVDEERCRVEVL